MTFASVLHDTMIALGIVFIADLPFGIWLGRALKRLQPVREIHTPSQLTHRQSSRISERSGKGDEAAFHTTAITTEVDQ